eukprot:4370928-Pyramimonas_sp.AAC.1
MSEADAAWLVPPSQERRQSLPLPAASRIPFGFRGLPDLFYDLGEADPREPGGAEVKADCGTRER